MDRAFAFVSAEEISAFNLMISSLFLVYLGSCNLIHDFLDLYAPYKLATLIPLGHNFNAQL